MKNLKRIFGTALLLTVMAVQAQAAADVDAADYFSNRPFRRATCSNVDSFVPVDSVPAVLQGRHGAGATVDNLIETSQNPDVVLTAPASYYSRRMVESQGKAWSADKSWDYVSGLVTKSLLKAADQYPEDAWSLTAYDWCKLYADKALNADGSF